MSETQVFVFGSNESGVHGKGAAKVAKEQYGAAAGVGRGPTGSAYALPTKGLMYFENGRPKFNVLPLHAVEANVREFLEYARANSARTYRVTAVGCGLAGYTPEQVAPMFAAAPPCCLLPPEFRWALGWLPSGRFWKYGE